ncbi:MAG: hypothetical protein M3Y03_02325 [Verrucomicrobiota bacterium]|nr:hypothetical protein [Verrucomicrobiota bacterium]
MRGLLLVITCSVAFLSPLARGADDPLPARIIAFARTVGPDDYAYTRTIRTEEVAKDKSEPHVVIERFDPTKPGDQRWSFVSVDDRAPNAKEMREYRDSLPKRRPAYYGRVALYFTSPASKSVDAQGRPLFHFSTMPKDTIMAGDTDLSAHISGDVLVDTSSSAAPFLSEVRFHSTTPTRIKLIAKIDRFDTTTRYRMLPDGQPVPSEFESEVSGSLLGQSGTIRTRISFSDYRRVEK